MTVQRLNIKHVRISELYEFARGAIETTAPNGLIPITSHRALAHSLNPYADSDDVALLVAYYEDECVGYFGILPGRLETPAGMHKVYWASTFFVDPRHRRWVAPRILKEAISLGYDLIVTGTNDAVDRLYRAMKFREFGPLTYRYITLQCRTERLLLSMPFRVLRRILIKMGVGSSWIDRAVADADDLQSSVLRLFQYRRLAKLTALALGDVRYVLRYEPFEPGSLLPFPDSCYRDKAAHFYRGPDVIDWMLRYKWVISEHDAPRMRVRYMFSDVRQVFTFLHLSLFSRSGSDPIGFVILSLSRRSANSPRDLKVLDFHIRESIPEEVLIGVVVRAAADVRADTIVFPNQVSLSPLACARNGLRIEIVQRPYFCLSAVVGGPLDSATQTIALNYCDGDMAFV
jgi:hypothetical protein